MTFSTSHPTEFKIKKVEKVGPVHGFTFVLENFFGQSSGKRGPVSHLLYVHEPGVLPDRWNIFGGPIEIFSGKRHEISLAGNQLTTTSKFDELNFKTRKCALESEKNQFLLKATSVFDKKTLFEKYSSTNCIMSYLLEKSYAQCNCITWEIAKYFKTSGIKVLMMYSSCKFELFKLEIQAFQAQNAP